MSDNTPTIKINMDKACSRCGKPGAVGNGICLACAADLLEHPEKRDETIVVDCKIDNVTTNWPKHEVRITFGATVEDTEYEAKRLGEIGRLEQPVTVMIHRRDESLMNAIRIDGRLDSVRTDHVSEKTTIAITAMYKEELEPKLVALGVISSLDVKATARFSSLQRRLL
jgi:hypothetical protein